jgi:hypothetical protein
MGGMEIMLGVLIGVLCAILYHLLFHMPEHNRNRARNVYGARAGNLQNAQQCRGGSECSNINNNAKFYGRKARG